MVTAESVNSSGGGLEGSLHDKEGSQTDERPDDKGTGFAKSEVEDIQHCGARSTFKKRGAALKFSIREICEEFESLQRARAQNDNDVEKPTNETSPDNSDEDRRRGGVRSPADFFARGTSTMTPQKELEIVLT